MGDVWKSGREAPGTSGLYGGPILRDFDGILTKASPAYYAGSRLQMTAIIHEMMMVLYDGVGFVGGVLSLAACSNIRHSPTRPLPLQPLIVCSPHITSHPTKCTITNPPTTSPAIHSYYLLHNLQTTLNKPLYVAAWTY